MDSPRPRLASFVVALGLGLVLLPTRRLVAQELVKNGDFGKGLAGWTVRGWGHDPKLDSFDMQGIGTSACFGANPGGKAVPPPFTPISLVQRVTVSSTKRYAIHAQIAVTTSLDNSIGGTYELWFDGRRVDRITFGFIKKGEVLRGRLCAQVFWPNTSTAPELIVAGYRAATANATTPRAYIDEVSVRETVGPVLCLREDRKLGAKVTLEVETQSNLQWVAYFLGTARLAQGARIPGMRGSLWVDPKGLQLLFVAQTSNSRTLRQVVTLPTTPTLHAAPLWLQGSSLAPFGWGPEEFLPLHR